MSSDDSVWFDPRLSVFIIWGIFVCLFICIPSKRFVQRLLYQMGCTCCGYEEEIAPTNISGQGMSYEILSNARKQEIDSLRASHLTYRLHPFSLTLAKKHMLRRDSDSESLATTPLSSYDDDNDTPLPQDRKPDPQSSHTGDVETGFVRGIDPPEKEEENEEEEDAQYTHVLIPKSGHNFDGVDVHKNLIITSTVDEKKPKEEKKPNKIRLFEGRSKEEAPGEAKEEIKTMEGGGEGGGERRSCPIFCAICLTEYEVSERVSWSSNPACTHVFHEDCVVQWLVSLGRTKSKMQRFSSEPSEAQLLNFGLECPCCRQEFISRGHADLPDICSPEERV